MMPTEDSGNMYEGYKTIFLEFKRKFKHYVWIRYLNGVEGGRRGDYSIRRKVSEPQADAKVKVVRALGKQP